MEVYVDDMITKSMDMNYHVQHLQQTFSLFQKYKMKLNLEKCVFGVSLGKFLRFMVSKRIIEANQQKIKAIQEMKSPTTLKDLQSLTRRLAALSMFISKAIDKCF